MSAGDLHNDAMIIKSTPLCRGALVCRKTYIIFKNGVWGVAPMRVVSRWCRCVVQRLCATDCKHPCLVRAAAPHSAPARTPGVYAQRLCTMQSQPSIHCLSPRGRGLGIGIENLLYFYKYRLFIQTESTTLCRGAFAMYVYCIL